MKQEVKRIRNCYYIREDYQDATRKIAEVEKINPSAQLELALREYFKKYPEIVKPIIIQ